MTSGQQELIEELLNFLGIVGGGGLFPDIESWHERIREAEGPDAPDTLDKASELIYNGVLSMAQYLKKLKERDSGRQIYRVLPGR